MHMVSEMKIDIAVFSKFLKQQAVTQYLFGLKQILYQNAIKNSNAEIIPASVHDIHL